MTYSQEKIVPLSMSKLGHERRALKSKAHYRTLRSLVHDFIIKDGKPLAQLEAWGLFGCGDLRTAIRDIRRQLKKAKSKYRIVTKTNKDVRGRLYGRYYRELLPTTRTVS